MALTSQRGESLELGGGASDLWYADSAYTAYEAKLLHIQFADVQRVLLDEFTSRLYFVAH